MRFENEFYQIIKNATNNSKNRPINLGGIAGPGGGVGGPPGGFRGTLPQTRVSYDEDEYGIITTSGSPSLLDNLNHIRYRLNNIVVSGGSNAVYIGYTAPLVTYSGQIWIDIS